MAKDLSKTTQAMPLWTKRIVGRGSSEWVIRRADCPAFDAYDLVEIGHISAVSYYRVARDHWPFIVVVICVGGLGTIRIGEQSWKLGTGQALLLPPEVPQDWESEPLGWSCTTLHYRAEGMFSHNMKLPRLISLHAQSLEAMILAFRSEYQSDKDPVLMRQMLDIIQTKVFRLFNPSQNAGRLWPLWSVVLEQPDFNWTIEALSHRAHLSGEHLRRICLAESKRSPMAQVTWLRLKAAANRLAVGNEVVEEIAHQVGFESERAFRSAFTKLFQCSPSEYRQKNRQSFEALNSMTAAAERKPATSAQSSVAKDVSDYKPVASSTNPFMVRFDSIANAYFSKGKNPWFGDIPLDLPIHGVRRIHGIPFFIINQENGPSFLVLRSSRLRKDGHNKPVSDRVRIPLKRTIVALYFLHACGWGAEFGRFARYRLVYADRTSVEQPLVVLAGAHPDETDGSEANIQDWYFSWDQLDRPNVKPYDATPQSNPLASSQYLYTMEWINPHPEKSVTALEIISDPKCDATLAVLSITCL